jgi:hypothetical protein
VAAATLLVQLGAPHRALLHCTCQQVLNVLQVSEPEVSARGTMSLLHCSGWRHEHPLKEPIHTVAGMNTTYNMLPMRRSSTARSGRRCRLVMSSTPAAMGHIAAHKPWKC